jgi:hypothetical protein
VLDYPRRGVTPRLRLLLATGAALGLAFALVIGDAARRRADDASRATERTALCRLLGTADLALSSTSRWLRHPSLAEPGAPFADGPASLDTDPGGALITPPRDVIRRGAVRLRRIR